MTDTLSPSERSRRMSLIRGKDTKPEMTLRRLLHSAGLRYRLHVSTLPGRPDLVFPKYRAVVLIHGCFWHHHAGCSIATTPKSNIPFWREKFKYNVTRDAQNEAKLLNLGWRVLVVWECELSTTITATTTAARVVAWLRGDYESQYLDAPLHQRSRQKGTSKKYSKKER